MFVLASIGYSYYVWLQCDMDMSEGYLRTLACPLSNQFTYHCPKKMKFSELLIEQVQRVTPF